jgi:hypothetical protein
MLTARIAGLLAGVVVLFANAAFVVADERPAHHPRLHRALHHLRESRTELKEAAHDFGGHRVKALEAVNATISQIEKALRFVGDEKPRKGLGKDQAPGGGRYPHMHRAINALKEARAELQAAPHDFGGHRAQAVEDINRSLEQLGLALKHANARK